MSVSKVRTEHTQCSPNSLKYPHQYLWRSILPLPRGPAFTDPKSAERAIPGTFSVPSPISSAARLPARTGHILTLSAQRVNSNIVRYVLRVMTSGVMNKRGTLHCKILTFFVLMKASCQETEAEPKEGHYVQREVSGCRVETTQWRFAF